MQDMVEILLEGSTLEGVGRRLVFLDMILVVVELLKTNERISGQDTISHQINQSRTEEKIVK